MAIWKYSGKEVSEEDLDKALKTHQAGGAGADLARLKEDGIAPSIQLREIHHSKSQKRSEAGR